MFNSNPFEERLKGKNVQGILRLMLEIQSCLNMEITMMCCYETTCIQEMLLIINVVLYVFTDHTSRMTDVQSLKKGALVAATYDTILQVGPLRSCPLYIPSKYLCHC